MAAPFLALHAARPAAAWSLAVPFLFLAWVRLRARPPEVVVGTLALWREMPAAARAAGRARVRLPAWSLLAACGLLAGALACLGPRGASVRAPRTWTCVVDRSPSMGLADGGETRLARALAGARAWLERAGEDGARVRWVAPGRAPLELALADAPDADWLAPERVGGEPEWALHDRPGTLWITDREPAVERSHAGLFASGGPAVPGAVAADAHTTWSFEAGELRSAARERVLAVSVRAPEREGLPAVLERMLAAWCAARGLELARASRAGTLLEVELVPAREPGEPLAVERDGWRAGARGALPEEPPGDGEVWLSGRTSDGRTLPVVRARPGRIELALRELSEPAGDPALFALSWGRLLDGAALPPADVVALAERQAAGEARALPGLPPPPGAGAGTERGPVLDALLAGAALLLALGAYLLLPRVRGREHAVRRDPGRAAASHQ